MHPYSIDFMYQELTEEGFDIMGYDAGLAACDCIFSINDFMEDLEKLYTTALFYEALEGLCVFDDDAAYDLYKEGKYFEELPFFESFKCVHGRLAIDVNLADGKLVKEIQFHAEHQKTRNCVPLRVFNL